MVQTLHISPTSPVFAKLPVDSSGYGHVSCRYEEMRLIIEFEFFDRPSGVNRVGKLVFASCISFSFVDNDSNHDYLVPSCDTIYLIGHSTSRGREYKGYGIEFSNSEQTILAFASSCEVLL